MKRLWLTLVLVALMAAPAWAQEAPSPIPQPTPQAPPAVVNVTPNVTVDLPGDESAECSWRRPSTWWGCITGSAKQQIEAARERHIQEAISSATKFFTTPQPFNNDRVRELWFWLGFPLAVGLVTLLAVFAAGKGALGNPYHMTKGELLGNIVVALAAGAASIFIIPFLIDLSNEAARHMAFVPLDPSLIKHGGVTGTSGGWVGIVDFLALLIVLPIFVILLLLQLLRWLLVVFWCIFAWPAGALYTHPDTQDMSLTYVKGLGALLLAPVIDAMLLSIMWWVVFTGHDIFPISWGAWLDGLLIVLTALTCLVVEAKTLVIAFGVRNYSGLKRALRRGANRGVTSWQNSVAAAQDQRIAAFDARWSAYRKEIGL